MKTKTIVKKINQISNNYLDYVEGVGNECAYTDRMIEAIIDEAKKLEKAYGEFLASLRK